jgi:LacI family transcriptional regulator
MTQSLTIEEIAALAQVSRSTVSRVLNDHPNVRPMVRDRVLQVIRENNYAPRAAARSLASNRTHSIGVLFPVGLTNLFHDPFFALLVQGIMEGANRRGYFVMLSMVAADKEQEFYTKILRSRPYDGLIMPVHLIDDPVLPLLLKDHIPLVLCDRHPYLQHVSWVEIDNREGARQAVLHLLRLGHRRIATIAGPLELAAGLERRDGYKQALLENAVRIDPDLIVQGDFNQESGFTGAQTLLSLPKPPTAIFAANDNMANGALRAIRAAGLRVPQDIALVGFDDLPFARLTDVPLTTVRQPVVEVGAAASEILIDQLEQQDFAPIHRRLPLDLIVRDSCGAALRRSESIERGW